MFFILCQGWYTVLANEWTDSNESSQLFFHDKRGKNWYGILAGGKPVRRPCRDQVPVVMVSLWAGNRGSSESGSLRATAQLSHLLRENVVRFWCGLEAAGRNARQTCARSGVR